MYSVWGAVNGRMHHKADSRILRSAHSMWSRIHATKPAMHNTIQYRSSIPYHPYHTYITVYIHGDHTP